MRRSTTLTVHIKVSPTPGHWHRCPSRSPTRTNSTSYASAAATASAAYSTSTNTPLDQHRRNSRHVQSRLDGIESAATFANPAEPEVFAAGGPRSGTNMSTRSVVTPSPPAPAPPCGMPSSSAATPPPSVCTTAALEGLRRPVPDPQLGARIRDRVEEAVGVHDGFGDVLDALPGDAFAHISERDLVEGTQACGDPQDVRRLLCGGQLPTGERGDGIRPADPERGHRISVPVDELEELRPAQPVPVAVQEPAPRLVDGQPAR